jgi:hypothetical protein
MPESMTKSTNSLKSVESESPPKSPVAGAGEGPAHRRVMQMSTDEEGTEWTSDDSIVREWTAVRNPFISCFPNLTSNVRLKSFDHV